MNEHVIHRIPEDKVKKETKEMCDSCIHNDYCIGAYKKDHWCGNHVTLEQLFRSYKRRESKFYNELL